MTRPRLYVGNRNYSSWSLRPWLALTWGGLDFETVDVDLDQPGYGQGQIAEVLAVSPTGRVPALHVGELVVWDSLAIAEWAAEQAPSLWPRDPAARAVARAVTCEMHAGFAALRSACPMNLGLEAPFQAWGGEAAASDVRRIVALWAEARARFGIPSGAGPFLFGAFTAADAMYAPVTTRLTSYGWPIDAQTRAYCDAVQGLPAFREWKAAAAEEPWVLRASEVVAASRVTPPPLA